MKHNCKTFVNKKWKGETLSTKGTMLEGDTLSFNEAILEGEVYFVN